MDVQGESRAGATRRCGARGARRSERRRGRRAARSAFAGVRARSRSCARRGDIRASEARARSVARCRRPARRARSARSRWRRQFPYAGDRRRSAVVSTEYRNNQAWLLEVPPPQPEPVAPDLASLEGLRSTLENAGRTTLTSGEARQVFASFGLPAEAPHETGLPAITLGVATDRRFGPVIFVRPARSNSLAQRRASMLPPLNARLAADLLAQPRDAHGRAGSMLRCVDALVGALTRLSALACALPWVRSADARRRQSQTARA